MRLAAFFLLGLMSGLGPLARADVVLAATRVIYAAAEREATLRFSNAGAQPALVEVWADTGNVKSTLQSADAPFLVMPPIARVEPGRSQSVRITYTGAAAGAADALPADRESLFWLNVLDVPPLPAAQAQGGGNFLQVVMRSRIKLIYRPEGLAGTPAAAARDLAWQLLPAGEGKGFVLRAVNASAFYVALAKAELRDAGTVQGGEGGGTVPPRGYLDWPLSGLAALPAGPVRVDYQSIDDYGALGRHEAKILPREAVHAP